MHQIELRIFPASKVDQRTFTDIYGIYYKDVKKTSIQGARRYEWRLLGRMRLGSSKDRFKPVAFLRKYVWGEKPCK